MAAQSIVFRVCLSRLFRAENTRIDLCNCRYIVDFVQSLLECLPAYFDVLREILIEFRSKSER